MDIMESCDHSRSEDTCHIEIKKSAWNTDSVYAYVCACEYMCEKMNVYVCVSV